DWVSLSYPVHGLGRIWKITLKEPVDQAPLPRETETELDLTLALQQLGDADPYVRTAAMEVLQSSPETLKSHDWRSRSSAVARAHFAVALKRSDPIGAAGIIPDLLNDSSADVRYVGIKWIADEKLVDFREDLAAQLDRDDLKRRDLYAVVAAMAEVGGGLKKEFSPGDALLALARDPSKSGNLRALALHGVPVDHNALTVEVLDRLTKATTLRLQKEAVRTLAIHPDPARVRVLSEVAASRDHKVGVRADAIAGLAEFASEEQPLLESLLSDPSPIVAEEARRTLGSAGLKRRDLGAKPAMNDIAAWEALLEAVPGEADLSVGRRLFFHGRLATCSKCHAMNGRGLEVGPDLTTIGQQAGGGVSWLLTHILDPSAEVAPYFRPQMITTRDGQSRMGFILGKEGKAQGYIGPDGSKFSVLKADVVAREELPISLMPPGLIMALTDSEIRDLLTYLLEGRE
ncbi:MAG: cytochrome C, partial [Verrucomicrobiota bacterium]